MASIDNISSLLGDDFKQTIKHGVRLKVAASCFSMYVFEKLKAELEKLMNCISVSSQQRVQAATNKRAKESGLK